MDSGHGNQRRRMSDNIERDVDVDRLSSLPNDLIHKILSFTSIKETVRTISWSSRYRFIWTTMPYLNFSDLDFPKLSKFSKFVTQFLKHRDSRIDVSSLKLRFRGKVPQPPFVKKLMDYAGSHNLQQLDLDFFYKKHTEFPLSLFGSAAQSLKHISLGSDICGRLKATSTLELPVLTTLKIRNVTFCSDDHTDNCAGLLSKCANLKNLTLESCKTVGLSSFSICHPGLANLTIEQGLSGVKVVNVVAPQLENLTIGGYYPLFLSTDGFRCLKEADICFSNPIDTDAPQMVCLLQQLYNVKFLTLSLEIIELLSSSVELISHQPSPFVNLKSLTVYPKKLYEGETMRLPKGKVNLSTEVKSYLLDSSPGATFTMFSREDIIAMKDMSLARKLMDELRVLLEQEKAITETKGKAPMESDNALILMESWKDLNVKLGQRTAKACLIISKLHSIKRLLKKLPATNRAMVQPCFSSLCAETDTVTSKITDFMKMQCDENQKRSSVCFHEFTTNTTMEASS